MRKLQLQLSRSSWPRTSDSAVNMRKALAGELRGLFLDCRSSAAPAQMKKE